MTNKFKIEKKKMKLISLIVEGLFGHFRHEIFFRKEENITILTAPNGYGKTIILKILDSIINNKLLFIKNLEFSKIEMVFDIKTITIEKLKKKSVRIKSNKMDEISFSLDETQDFEDWGFIRNINSKLPPYIHQYDDEFWVDERDDEIITTRDVIERYIHYPYPLERKIKSKRPKWYLDFVKSINSHFIQDQRLILRKLDVTSSRPPRRRFTDTIEKYASELAEHINQAGKESSNISQRLDSSFPARLLGRDSSFKELSIDELKDELKLIQNKRESLANFNLLVSEEYLPGFRILEDIKEEDIKVLTLYVQDTREKLGVYDELYMKIELFSNILNKKRLSFKKILITPKEGFVFQTDERKPLKLTELSSGEQHQVVLLYELIFNTKDNVIVLIDEPEISLHIAWQKDFLKDLKKILELQKMSVIIATHSPQIIDNNWDLTVDLSEGC